MGAVDEALGALGLERRVALTVPHVMVVPHVLPRGDMVATVGARAARLFAQAAPLCLFATPLELAPWRLAIIWPRKKTAILASPGCATC